MIVQVGQSEAEGFLSNFLEYYFFKTGTIQITV